MWHNVKLSDVSLECYGLVADEDVKKPSEQTKLTCLLLSILCGLHVDEYRTFLAIIFPKIGYQMNCFLISVIFVIYTP